MVNSCGIGSFRWVILVRLVPLFFNSSDMDMLLLVKVMMNGVVVVLVLMVSDMLCFWSLLKCWVRGGLNEG